MASPSEFDDETHPFFEDASDPDNFFDDEDQENQTLIPNPNTTNSDSFLLSPLPQTPNPDPDPDPDPGPDPNQEDSSRPLFQRIFTEDDELLILEQFLDFVTKRGTSQKNYRQDTGPFYDQIKNKIPLDITKNQLIEKIRRLKRKFRSLESRISNASDRFRFKSDHERRRYEVSKRLWSNAVKKRKRGKENDERLDNVNSMEEAVRSCLKPVFKELFNVGLGLNSGNLNSMDFLNLPKELGSLQNGEKWKAQRILELEVYLKRVELLEEHVRGVLEELRANSEVDSMKVDG